MNDCRLFVLVLRLFVLVLLLLFNLSVSAEGSCPAGYSPTGGGAVTGCAPIYNYSLSGAQQAPADPGPLWQKRWGAIAIDGQNSKFAGVDGLSTSSKAKKAAIKQCRSNGGKKCKVIADYYNQCGALAWGQEGAIASRGPIIEEVMKQSIAACSEKTSGCQVYYSGCSYPERVQ